MAFQTEYEFELPKGFIDHDGNLHRTGIMRLATAADEILPIKDPRVQQNPSYLTIIVLSRVITKLGSLQSINTKTIENMFTADLEFLQLFYQQINENQKAEVDTVCPKCNHEFKVGLDFLENLRV